MRRGWGAPSLQAVVLIAVVLVGAARIDAAQADIAADSGAGPAVAVQAVAREVAPPVTLGVPRLGITSRLIGLRKTRTGQLQVPADPQRAGWYSEGAAPGDPGPAVIVGHVDSYRGPGVFARIKTLRKGDRIDIRRADGSLASFQVRLVQTYSKRSFPTRLVYVGDRRPSLRLVTCGGAFDPVTKHYLSNTVVFAAPYVTPRRAPAAKARVTTLPLRSTRDPHGSLDPRAVVAGAGRTPARDTARVTPARRQHSVAPATTHRRPRD